MMMQIANVLTPEQVKDIVAALAADGESFSSGKSTAGWHAKGVKNNEQSRGSAAQMATAAAREALLKHPVFAAAARPRDFVRILVSRYRPGMAYGSHVDDAIMDGKRTDMSFTLFLSEPASYDGGELVIEATGGDTVIKLAPGDMVLYQTTSLHRVEEVTRGERLAIVGWVRSYIRNPEHRELLFDLDQTVAALREIKADRRLLDRVFKVRNTLTRMWAED
jgi:PKHD-type hydroxylase